MGISLLIFEAVNIKCLESVKRDKFKEIGYLIIFKIYRSCGGRELLFLRCVVDMISFRKVR